MGDTSWTVRRLTGTLGATIEGLDLAKPLDADQHAALNDCLLTHRVVFLRDQHDFDDERHLALARGFGELSVYPVLKLLEIDRPLETIEDGPDNPPGADQWHTDVTWIERPPKVAILAAQHIPEFGGDTLWADTCAAYEALSPVMREMIDPLVVRHGLGDDFVSRVAVKAGQELADKVRDALCHDVEHPLVRTHPETGNQSLFVAGGFMKDVVGMAPAESELLLSFLMDHATAERFQCRWRWREGDVAIWDERCTLHHALPDHFPQHRKMRRCTVDGDRPVH